MRSKESIVLRVETRWSVMKHVVLERVKACKARKIGMIFEPISVGKVAFRMVKYENASLTGCDLPISVYTGFDEGMSFG
jgi:hypothetical protein